LPFEIDVCGRCHLIWFDDREFQSLLGNLKKELGSALPEHIEQEVALTQMRLDNKLRSDMAREHQKIESVKNTAIVVMDPAVGVPQKAAWILAQVVEFLVSNLIRRY
jgi:hypothetical protein